MRRFIPPGVTGTFVALAFGVAALAGLAVPAAASPPVTANGTFATSDEVDTLIRIADGVVFINVVDTFTYAGDLIGSGIDVATLRVFRDGSFTAKGTETCNSCTLGGRTGGFTAVFTYTGSGEDFAGTETFISGTGGLAGLHGGGSFQGDESGATYSYVYHFDP